MQSPARQHSSPVIPAKLKTCRNRGCQEKFSPRSSMQVACSPRCAMDLAAKKREARERRAALDQRRYTRARLEEMKTPRQLVKEAQLAFNAYIRERDRGKPCISCGASPNDADLITGSKWDAGHYRSTGANPELRFNELNCNAQCVKCNRHLSGNAVNYRIGLIERIGEGWVKLLEGPHPPAYWRACELRAIRDTYKRKLKALKAARKGAE